jgi:mRNA-degrading endonuclease toxin of MazEF toxin-antitoxin module
LKVKRGEIWTCDLNPTQGGEINNGAKGNPRTVLVISHDILNNQSNTVLVLPITQGIHHRSDEGENLLVNLQGTGTETQGVIVPTQARTVSKQRLKKRVESVPGYAVEEAVEKFIATFQ